MCQLVAEYIDDCETMLVEDKCGYDKCDEPHQGDAVFQQWYQFECGENSPQQHEGQPEEAECGEAMSAGFESFLSPEGAP